MTKVISSLHNPFIKHLQLLQKKSKLRRTSGEFIIEGLQEICYAYDAGYDISHLLICSDIFEDNREIEAMDADQIDISMDIFEKLAYRASTGGILAVAKSKDLSLNRLQFQTSTPLILIAEAPEKPGNIGALLRTCDAANVDAVIIANPKTDLYNPNIIRSSVGTLFTNTIATGSTSEIIPFLKQHHIKIYAAALQNSKSYLEQDFKKGIAIVVGTEHDGLSEEWREQADQIVKIPMQGQIDSLNVSVSAAILIFEAKRQRSSSEHNFYN